MNEKDYEKYLDKVEQAANLVQGIVRLERQFQFIKANFVEKETKTGGGVDEASSDR